MQNLAVNSLGLLNQVEISRRTARAPEEIYRRIAPTSIYEYIPEWKSVLGFNEQAFINSLQSMIGLLSLRNIENIRIAIDPSEDKQKILKLSSGLRISRTILAAIISYLKRYKSQQVKSISELNRIYRNLDSVIISVEYIYINSIRGSSSEIDSAILEVTKPKTPEEIYFMVATHGFWYSIVLNRLTRVLEEDTRALLDTLDDIKRGLVSALSYRKGRFTERIQPKNLTGEPKAVRRLPEQFQTWIRDEETKRKIKTTIQSIWTFIKEANRIPISSFPITRESERNLVKLAASAEVLSTVLSGIETYTRQRQYLEEFKRRILKYLDDNFTGYGFYHNHAVIVDSNARSMMKNNSPSKVIRTLQSNMPYYAKNILDTASFEAASGARLIRSQLQEHERRLRDIRARAAFSGAKDWQMAFGIKRWKQVEAIHRRMREEAETRRKRREEWQPTRRWMESYQKAQKRSAARGRVFVPTGIPTRAVRELREKPKKYEERWGMAYRPRYFR